jgi:hypothetical protein
MDNPIRNKIGTEIIIVIVIIMMIIKIIVISNNNNNMITTITITKNDLNANHLPILNIACLASP